MSQIGYQRKQAELAAERATEIPRDRWGRPLIIPVGGGEPVPYTRVSTLAKALDDTSNLTTWKQRKTAEGLLKRPDLMTRLGGALANGNPDTDKATKAEFNRICKEATEAAGASSGASSGTGLHSYTEAVDRGEWPEFISAPDAERLSAYREATAGAGYIALEAEAFVVNDEVTAAGTFDRLWLCPDGKVRVGDLKSGRWDLDYPLGVTTQIAIYANGRRYDPATGERAPIHAVLDLTTGLLVHLPPSGGCEVVPLDLERGWRAARAADFVHHEARKWGPAELHRTEAAS
jgi:hypothetical protein